MSEPSWPMVTVANGSAPLGKAALDGLIDGRIALLRLQGALSSEILATARKVILEERPSVNRYSNASLTTIGPYLASRLSRLDSYFEEASRTDAVFSDLQRDPRAIARCRLAETLGLERIGVLQEPGRGPYASAVVRLHADGVSNPLHNDHIVRDGVGSGLRVARVAAQLSCVVCIQECEAGGELELFRRRWSAGDEAWKVRNGLGYGSEVAEGAPRLQFAPATGDIYVLNPAFYHAIAAVSGRTRITVGFFFGLFEDSPGEAFAWS